MKKELESGDIIPFIRGKDYKFIQNLGAGSFSRTVLIKDEIIDELYACKKYEPSITITDTNEKKRYFDKFISEVKILNKIVHPNIVRIYNNYIYPNEQVGYIIMEYVENAKSLNEYIGNNTETLNNIFEQIISGFCYLEQHKLCHRDIRSNNILINSNGIVKIIDFGFGKRYSTDNEPIYNNKTEIYFVGQLIKQIIEENNIKNFRYFSVLNEMIEYNVSNRINSFAEVQNKMSEKELRNKAIFSQDEKDIYKEIVEKLDETIESVEYGTNVNEINVIIQKLEAISVKYCLEDKVLNNKDFAECFFGKVVKVNESSTGWNQYDGECYDIYTIPTSLILQSIDWLNNCNYKQREIIKQNLQGRLEKYNTDFADLPF